MLKTIFIGFIVLMLTLACSESKEQDAAARDQYGCHRDDIHFASCHERGEYHDDMCKSYSTLLATTVGSPNSISCSNKRHRMRVEPVTKAGEEIGALVFCECVK